MVAWCFSAACLQACYSVERTRTHNDVHCLHHNSSRQEGQSLATTEGHIKVYCLYQDSGVAKHAQQDL